MNSELIVKVIISVAFGISLSIFITPIYIFIRKLFFVPFSNEKLLKKAIDEGNIVQAKLIKTYSDFKANKNDRMVSTGKKNGVYQYEYNGKKYKRQASSWNDLPENIELYFIKNPRKARTAEGLFITAKSPWISSYFIIAIIISFVVFCIFAYNLMAPNELMDYLENIIE